MKMKSSAKALYVHIPFCKNICSYCDFAKVIYQNNFVNDYFKSLFFELQNYKNKKYKTIYVGGGTPSSLPLNILEQLLQKLSKKLYKKYEFSIECNVEDITVEFLELLKKYKVNRVSIGVQTFNEKFIKLCNRKHTQQMAIDNISLAANHISNINIDMIYGFPLQTLKDVEEELDIIAKLPIKHLSYYSLIIEKNTVFYHKYENIDDKLEAKMYRLINKKIKTFGLKRYEISNFAMSGYKSQHNLIYWNNQHYDAVGLNASGYYDNTRYTNTRNLTNYNHKNYDRSVVELTIEDKMFEQIMLNLRLDKGLNFNEFFDKFGIVFTEKYKNELQTLKQNHLIKVYKTKIKTTFKGSLLLNQILELFMN